MLSLQKIYCVLTVIKATQQDITRLVLALAFFVCINIFLPDVIQILWFRLFFFFSEHTTFSTLSFLTVQCQWHPITKQLSLGKTILAATKVFNILNS